MMQDIIRITQRAESLFLGRPHFIMFSRTGGRRSRRGWNEDEKSSRNADHRKQPAVFVVSSLFPETERLRWLAANCDLRLSLP
jgi:hypothetical protein